MNNKYINIINIIIINYNNTVHYSPKKKSVSNFKYVYKYSYLSKQLYSVLSFNTEVKLKIER